MVIHMTHDQWMQEEQRLSRELMQVQARRDELRRHHELIPGPALKRRDDELALREGELVEAHAALVRLDAQAVDDSILASVDEDTRLLAAHALWQEAHDE